MARINYSALVSSIQGKLNGSTLRMQGGQGIIQNKPYRNPVGLSGVGDLTVNNSTPKILFWNRAYQQAMTQAAHAGNPFTQSIADIRDIVRGYGFTRVADNGSDTSAIATAMTPYFMFQVALIPTLDPAITFPDPIAFTATIVDAGPNIQFNVDLLGSWPSGLVLMDVSPPSSLVNYRLRQRVMYRTLVSTGPGSTFSQTAPDTLFSIPIVAGDKLFITLTLAAFTTALGVSPTSVRLLVQVT
jgi:hypothetical protein